jgi:phosphomannomutase
MSVFKAYDIRGRYGTEIDEDLAQRIGRCLPALLSARRFLVGRDARLSSPALAAALCRGLMEAGADVDDLGPATTPMVYCFTARDGYDASVQVTASHNPPADNGLKVSAAGAVPVGRDTGLAELERRVAAPPPAAAHPGRLRATPRVRDFLDFLRPWVPDLGGLRLAVDCSDGMAGLLARDLFGPDAILLNATPDGGFPHHLSNPLDPANRAQLESTVRRERLDAGVIFDGDADRVMFVDETGGFVPPDCLIPVVARRFLRAEPGATVLCDIRTSRGATEALAADGASVAIWKVGHAFAKVRLRETGAVCGGELAGHYYFRDFFCCDSGELAALIVLGELAAAQRRGETFSRLLAPVRRYANSGEVNCTVARPAAAIAAVRQALLAEAPPQRILEFDGLRLDYPDWWVNIRPSNTEPLLRLVVEACDDARLAERRAVIERLLSPYRDTAPSR